MITVYRIENSDGLGPFNCFGPNLDKISRILDEYGSFEHPTPYKDGIQLEYINEEVLGCVSLEQLKVWFPDPCRTKLEKLGFAVKKFNVKTAKIGKHQCAFKRSDVIDVMID